MAYQPNIPLATDRLKDSQADIQGNFQELNAYLNVNHTAIDGTADQGKHNMVTLVPQAVIPPTTNGQLNLFSSLDTVTGLNQLYLTYDGINISRMTGNIINFNLPTDISGSIPIAPGLYLKWFTHSVASLPANTILPQTVNYPIGGNIPVFNNLTALALFTKIKTGDGATFGEPYEIYWNTAETDATKIGIKLVNSSNSGVSGLRMVIMVIGF